MAASVKALLKLFFRKPMTYRFPPEMPLSEFSRGRHVLDMEKCRGCGACATICPNKAIEMVERETEDGKVRKYPQIDMFKCCFCGLCAEICPTGALKLTNFPWLVAMDKKSYIMPPEELAKPPELQMPPMKVKPKSVVDWARARSLWIVFYFTGCCFLEAAPWASSGFDMERFGLLTKGSPRQSDVLLVGGYVTTKTLRRIAKVYSQMPRPKYVMALGCCPATGGTYWDSYNVIKELDKYIPVDMWVAGCPPRPEPIGLAVVMAMDAIQGMGYQGKEEKVPEEVKVPCYEPKPGEKEMVFTVPFGPQHPASGNFSIRLRLDGEYILEAEAVPGYLHRGFEKLMEYRSWYQNIMIVQRICVLDGASYEIAYAETVEELAGIEPPDRAKYLRVIQAELSRIQSHLLNMGLVAKASGFDTVLNVAWGDREKVLYVRERLTGSRIYDIYSAPGGVRRDMPEKLREDIEEMVKKLRAQLEIYDDLLLKNPMFKERTVGVGKVDRDTAVEYDLVGPNLRASGIGFDVRKDVPYEVYGDLDFKVPCYEEGDAYHRTLVRRDEIEQSLNIIEQAVDEMPKGPFRKKVPFFMRVPKGEAWHCIESARGELCFHMVSDGSDRPYRVKVRGPTFDSILVLLPEVLKGALLADVPVVYWSFDNCPADHDR